MIKLLVVVNFLFLSACSIQMLRSRSEEGLVTEGSALVHKSDLEEAVEFLEASQYQWALDKFRLYKKAWPNSTRWFEASEGEAEALAGLGRDEEALQLFNEVIKNSKNSPRWIALALLRRSVSFERQGRVDLAFASLKDAETRANDLPTEVRDVELPFRLASLLRRMNRLREAQEYFVKTEVSLIPYLDPSRQKSPWLGATLFQISQIGSRPFSYSDYETNTLQFQAVQKYLVRCMEIDLSPWSERCLNHGKKSFFDYFQFVLTFREPVYADSFVSSRVELQKKIDMSVDLKVLLQQTHRFKSYDLAESSRAYEFFNYLEGLEKEVDDFLYSTPETTMMTEESQRLNGIKRAGQIKESLQ